MRALLCALFLTACSATDSGDEREPPGGGDPIAEYCAALGYAFDGTNETCTFPNGSSCPAVDFYEGACGQSFSYCEMHGGTIMKVTTTSGGSTSVYAECTTSSGTCMEQNFYMTHVCK